MTMVMVIMTMVKKYKETNNNNKTIIKWFFQPITQFSTSATTGNTNGNIGNAGVFTLGEKKTSRYISRKDIKSVTCQKKGGIYLPRVGKSVLLVTVTLLLW